MSDLFHERAPEAFIQKAFGVMRQAHWHIFQVLTKRAEHLEQLSPRIPWPENVWMGVSVENGDYIYRVDHLKRTGAKVKFISFEPLLGPMIDINLDGIDWVIVGGESGPKSRPMDESWVVDIQDRCRSAGVPFFFKQWGGLNKKKAGRVLRGRTWDEMPACRVCSV
jgi:protein gp37